MAKPNTSLLYEYSLESCHEGGLYWYHPHVHGTSMTTIGRGSAGLIFVEGPYQTYLDSLQIKRKFLQFQRVNIKDASDQAETTWYDYSAALPTNIYNVDSNNNAIPPTQFKPISYYPYCKNSNDYGPEGLCGCESASLSKTITNDLRDGLDQRIVPYPPSVGIYWYPLLNAQIQPVFSIHPNELQIFSYVNTTTITFTRISVDDHYMVVVGKDGVPSYFTNFNLTKPAIDPCTTHTPPGVKVNYLCCGPAERCEFFLIPKDGVSTSGRSFTMKLDPLDQNEFFANDSNNVYFTTSAGALITNIPLATISYDTTYIPSSDTNSISNFYLNPDQYNPNNPIVQTSNPNQNISMDEKLDYNQVGYLQKPHIKNESKLQQVFNVSDISYINNYRNYTKAQSFSSTDPTYNVVQITLDTSNKKHFFAIYDGRNDPEGVDILNPKVTRNTIQINNTNYQVFSIPVEIVYDSNGNDISEWVFYINDPDKSIYNSLINLTPQQKQVTFKFYTVETQQIPILATQSISQSDIYEITTKYAHRLVANDIIYYDLFNNTIFTVIAKTDYNKFTVSSTSTYTNNILQNAKSVYFDTYNIKAEYLYFYSKEIYTNNNTYNTTQFFNNNGPTFDPTNIDTFTSLNDFINSCFYTDPTDSNNTSYLYTKICERRNIYYSFSSLIGNSDEGSTQVDGKKYNNDICDTMLVNTRIEWNIENHTDVNHQHHQHVNSYQVCGYKDEAHGFNITPNRNASYVDPNNNYIPGDYPYNIQYDSTFNYITNMPYNPTISNPEYPETTYRFQNEIYVTFYGYEDTTSVPIGLGSNTFSGDTTGIVNAPYGTRGRIRIRFENSEYVGKYVHHCHLLDDQDMGMMKPIEIVGIDEISGNCYYPAPKTSRMPSKGIKTDYFNNIWLIQPN